MSGVRGLVLALAAGLLAATAPPAAAQLAPNRDYQPPPKGEALFDPRPGTRVEREAEATRQAAAAEAEREAAQVGNPLNAADPAAMATAAAAEPASEPAPTQTPMPRAEGYEPSAEALRGHASEAPAPEPLPPARSPVEPPRAYGYLLGDLLVQRVGLSVDGRAVDLAELPRRERIGAWVQRRRSWIERRADGSRWLALEYQIVNASKDLDVTRLPALSLPTTTAGVRLEVAEWPISVGAITAAVVRNRGGLVPLQPDPVAPLADPAPHRLRQRAAVLALLLLLAGWFGWWRWREWRARARLPFAQAQARLRMLPAGSDAAWRCLHQALDTCAGRTIQPGTLPALFAACPALAAERPAIEGFLAASAARFFAAGDAAADVAADTVDPQALCRRLRALERAEER